MDKKHKSNVVFRAWRKDPRTGKILYARNYGLKAWPIPIKDLEGNSETQSRTNKSE